ncbi:MAG: MFS transporter [Actinomycetes bacterium]
MSDTSVSPRQSRAYATLLTLGVVDAAAYSVIGPVLPTIALENDASALTMAALAAVFPLVMLVALAASGHQIRHGRLRLVLPVSIAFLAAGSMVFVLTDGLSWLFLGRALMGLGSGGLWMGITFRTLEYWPGQEYRCMSRVYAAYSIGALVGPGLGALPGTHLPFAAYLVVVLAALPLLRFLPEPTVRRPYVTDHSWRRSPGFWYAAAGIMLGMLAIGMVDGVLPLHFATLLSQTQIGVIYVGTALVTAAAAIGSGHVRPGAALLLGGLTMTVGVTGAGATTAVLAWLVTLVFIGFGGGAAQTGSTGVLLVQIPTERIVSAMTVWSQLGIVGYLIAPALGGPLVARFGYASLGLVPLVLGLVTLLLAGVTARANASSG